MILSTPSPSPVIAISGASAGIGLAIAKHFAQLSWNVSITARTATDLQSLEQKWAADFPNSTLHTIALDLAEPQAALQWAEALTDEFGRLDVLVHNLGQFQAGTLLDGPTDQLAHLLQTNVLSAHHITREMLALLQSAARPFMITIGSVATTDWPPPLAAYSISKFAQEGWHRELSKELKPLGIRSGLIRPGATHTRSWDGIEVDPSTLLRPETVAEFVAQIVFSKEDAHVEEITIRPSGGA